jgi:CBS domain-containing protein
LYENRISGAPVVDEENRLVGVVSEKDLLNIIFSGNIKTTKVSEIMTKNPVSFTPETDLDKISLTISERGFRRVIIVDEEKKVVGIVSRHDIIRIVLDQE